MRKIFVIIFALILSCILSTTYAQVHISVNFNLFSQPAWGPTGYDYVDYYYLPGIDVYYSVPLQCFYYNYRGRWIRSARLPERYHDYDLYRSYKVVINEREPWRRDRYYRDKYYRYRDRHDQPFIRDSRDPKYFENKYHPMHKEWLNEHRHDNGNHKGYYNRGRYGNKKDHHEDHGRRNHDQP